MIKIDFNPPANQLRQFGWIALVGFPLVGMMLTQWAFKLPIEVLWVCIGLGVLMGGLAAVNLALLAFASVVGARTMMNVSQSDHFRIRTLEFRGVELGSTEALRDRLDGLHAFNLFDLRLDQIATLVNEDPWVESCSIKRVLPDTLRIEVNERRPVAVALIDGRPKLLDLKILWMTLRSGLRHTNAY